MRKALLGTLAMLTAGCTGASDDGAFDRGPDTVHAGESVPTQATPVEPGIVSPVAPNPPSAQKRTLAEWVELAAERTAEPCDDSEFTRSPDATPAQPEGNSKWPPADSPASATNASYEPPATSSGQPGSDTPGAQSELSDGEARATFIGDPNESSTNTSSGSSTNRTVEDEPSLENGHESGDLPSDDGSLLTLPGGRNLTPDLRAAM